MSDDLFFMVIEDSYTDAAKSFETKIHDIIISDQFNQESNIEMAKQWLAEKLLEYASNNPNVIINGKPVSEIIYDLVDSISFKIIPNSEIDGVEIGWFAYEDEDYDNDQKENVQHQERKVLDQESINESIVLEYGTQLGDKSIKGSSVIANILLSQGNNSLTVGLKNNLSIALENILKQIEKEHR